MSTAQYKTKRDKVKEQHSVSLIAWKEHASLGRRELPQKWIVVHEKEVLAIQHQAWIRFVRWPESQTTHTHLKNMAVLVVLILIVPQLLLLHDHITIIIVIHLGCHMAPSLLYLSTHRPVSFGWRKASLVLNVKGTCTGTFSWSNP